MNGKIIVPLLAVALLGTNARAVNDSPPTLSLSELRERGAFAFPQKDAKVLCDNADLRLSAWNNQEYLFAQAVLWNDDDPSLGKTEDNREIGDHSDLMLDLDAAGKVTPNVDRNYLLNPWPELGGLHYNIWLGEGSTTPIQSDSKGRGAIRYVDISAGKKVRVDSFLIPLAEISRRVGDKIRLCYWGYSPKPPLTVNSVGYERAGRAYYGYHIPRSQYHEYVLAEGREIDVAEVPDGRNDISLSHRKNVPMPKVGQAAPEISAKEWINLKDPVTLARLRGKVVLAEFWATWCGPCIQGIPHLNQFQRKYGGKNFQLLSFVEEGHKTMDRFLVKNHVEYPIGLESNSLEDYGINTIPHAFVINQEGKVIWQGNSSLPEMEVAVASALNQP
jgi:thiol-disulfide isomerase/thioredoxin